VKKLLIIPLLWCSLLMAVNPTTAMLYSAFIPGGGQIYNKAYPKAAIVVGLQAWNIGRAIYNDSKADDFAKKSAQASDVFYQDYYKERAREYREKKTSDIWWIGVTAALSVLDAYVDAHLSNFEAEKEGLHLRFEEGKAGVEFKF
jgi:hypothetical protein